MMSLHNSIYETCLFLKPIINVQCFIWLNVLKLKKYCIVNAIKIHNLFNVLDCVIFILSERLICFTPSFDNVNDFYLNCIILSELIHKMKNKFQNDVKML